MADSYKPAVSGKRIPMPGNQADWPEEGRPINPLSGWENRLVADGDLIKVEDAEAKQITKTAASLKADGSNGGDN